VAVRSAVAHEQTKPRVVLVERAQVAVARVPSPVIEIAIEIGDDALDEM
jgi:hypothetical protein